MRYWKLELTDENYNDMQNWVRTEEMVGLVDEEKGGIIGYINREHAERIIKELTKGENIA